MNVGTHFEPSREFNRWQNYRPDTAIPLHRVTFNGIVDVPFGRGQALAPPSPQRHGDLAARGQQRLPF